MKKYFELHERNNVDSMATESLFIHVSLTTTVVSFLEVFK